MYPASPLIDHSTKAILKRTPLLIYFFKFLNRGVITFQRNLSSLLFAPYGNKERRIRKSSCRIHAGFIPKKNLGNKKISLFRFREPATQLLDDGNSSNAGGSCMCNTDLSEFHYMGHYLPTEKNEYLHNHVRCVQRKNGVLTLWAVCVYVPQHDSALH
ncbi:hypothetical protein NPIL_488971 [Nephila pilipes]|uniref:Uncharacterized protein n=1 Tax=Nephila pilipes TaxID=299642 RepID=A0A8X6N3R1_NEPPI|nr:hypothetical protein NPIL_488971 [Nephila pilipes]